MAQIERWRQALTHASRAETMEACFQASSGGRVSNAWESAQQRGISPGKPGVIPHIPYGGKQEPILRKLPLLDEPAWD